jgi:hypothetical protein
MSAIDFQFNELIKIYEQFRKSGTHNYLGCKIPVQSGINVQFFIEKLVDYHDNIIYNEAKICLQFNSIQSFI